MIKWQQVKLGDIASNIQTGPFGSQLHQSDYSEIGTPVVMPKDLVDGKISEQSIARVEASHVKRLAKHKIQNGDILYSRRGDVGRCAYAGKEESGWLCGTGCLRVTIDESHAFPKFIFYQLQTSKSVGWVKKHAVGSTMLNLNTSILSNVPVSLPPLEVQRKIADVLSTYDDLIENNRKQIKLLEEAAQRLYKEWFIDLRFPGHENTKIIDGIPEGWDRKKLGEWVNTFSGGTPSRKNKEFYQNGSNFWLKTQELTDCFIFETEEKITDRAIEHSSAKYIYPNSIIMAMYGATIGKLGIAATRLTCNQACCVFDLSSDFEKMPYLYLWLKSNRDFFVSQGIGSAQSNLSQAMIKNFDIIVPCQTTLSNFSPIATKIFAKILKLQKSVKEAKNAQDRLLSKLMTANWR